MSEPPKPRLRRLDDWVYRLRAWVWYAALKTKCYKSDDELDDLFVPGAKSRASEERLRRFAGIRRSGHDPGVVHLKEGKLSLVDRVEAHNLYRGTSGYYNSKLWKLLTPPALNLDEINTLVIELTKEKNLYRPTDEEAIIACAG